MISANRTFRLLFALFALFVLDSGRLAQAQDPFRLYKDYDRYRYFPRLPQATERPDPLPQLTDEVKGDTTVLVKELKTLVVVDHPDKVKGAAGKGQPVAAGFQIEPGSQISLASCPEFGAALQQRIGQPVSMMKLNQLAREVILLYREHDLPVVDVAYPEQDITDGVVYMVITEGHIGCVTVDGSCWFDNQVLLDQLHLCPGQPIQESQLMDELEWLYRNPYRTIDLELSPGEQRGLTDVNFHVKDKKPVRFYTGYEDTGTRPTGLERVFFGFNWYDALWQDDVFGYQYTGSSDFDRLEAHSLFYSHAFNNRDVLTVYANIADYEADVPGFGVSPGNSWQILPRLYRELEDCDNYEHGVTAGFDFKQSSSTLEFAPNLVFGGTFDVFQLLLGYQGRLTDDLGVTSFSLDGYVSPGGFSDHNATGDFRQVRAFSQEEYAYARGLFKRSHQGPWCTELVARITGQWASTNLVPTEQLAFGGYNSVRGYDSFSVLGDSGYFVNLEWYTPGIPLGCIDGNPGELRLLSFYDMGVSFNHTLLPGEDKSVDLQSAGIGLRYEAGSNIQLQLDYGWQMTNVPGINNDDRIHVNAVFSF